MAINSKFRPPKIAITRGMIDEGKLALDSLTSDEAEHTDDELVANIFFAMWETYWAEIAKEGEKRAKPPAIVTPFKSSLILPKAN